jgi:hypothetical protein
MASWPLSRSQHQLPGFGVPGERGQVIERFVTSGDASKDDLLDGVPLGWSVSANRGYADRAIAGPLLLTRDEPAARPAAFQDALGRLPSSPRVRDAADATQRRLRERPACSGARSHRAVVRGEDRLSIEVVPRPSDVELLKLSFPDGSAQESQTALSPNAKVAKRELVVPVGALPSIPLADRARQGHQVVSDAKRVGDPRGPRRFRSARCRGRRSRISDRRARPVHVTDPVRGERVRETLIVPPATVTPVREAAMAVNGKAAPSYCACARIRDAVKERDALVPAGWLVDPAAIRSSWRRRETKTVPLRGDAGQGRVGHLGPAVEIDGRVERARARDRLPAYSGPVTAAAAVARARGSCADRRALSSSATCLV